MPSAKQGGGYTLTFSKKNQDVRLILDNKQKDKIVITDYICNAIRFFESNKNKELNNNIISNIDIEKLIEDKIKIALENNGLSNINNNLKNEVIKHDLENTDDIDEFDIEED